MKKIFTLGLRIQVIVFAILFLSLVISCSSTKNRTELFSDINYTDAEVVRDEISAIKKIAEENPVKALWRAKILSDNAGDFESVSDLLDECFQKAQAKCIEFWDGKKYVDARRVYHSLVAAGCDDFRDLSFGEGALDQKINDSINDSINASMPTLAGDTGGVTKLSDMIKGTVTVFVDKGVKVEGGVGYADSVLGSGFFISKNGYIITNHHVISSCVDPSYKGFAKLYIRLAEDPDTKIPAKVVGYDDLMDLALLKTEVDAPYVFPLGSSKDLSIGDSVYAIGSPLGLDRTLTRGIVSALDRNLLAMGNVFQIDAAVNAGNSGGPLIDEKGFVQAIVFAGVANFQGLNFAIPVEYLKAELPYLFNGGKCAHPWVQAYGKTSKPVGSGTKSDGVEVIYSMPGGSAYRAGLLAGKKIVSWNGNEIKGLDDLHLFMLQTQPDTIVKIGAVDTDGKKSEHVLYMEKRPKSPGYEIYTHDLISSSLLPIIGMELVHTSTSNKKLYGIKKIVRGSAADEAGFSEGDPVQIMTTDLQQENTVLVVQIYAKKRRNGFLDVGMALGAPLDSEFYF